MLLFTVLAGLGIAYLAWSPGERVTDGRHDRRSNAIWIQHGWLGDDTWFARNHRDKSLFRDDKKIQPLAETFAQHGIKYVYPHLCPCNLQGAIPRVDDEQTECFLRHFGEFRVLPWVGGTLDVCALESSAWRDAFISSINELLKIHPGFSGIHLNIEPLPSGDANFLRLLDEIRAAMPAGKILSVAAYPPPTRWQPSTDVHWDAAYFRQVAARTDQMAVMMYDTGIRLEKPYRRLMREWTVKTLEWAGETEVLLGVPAYDNAGVGYHVPRVENLRNALFGIHAGLLSFKEPPQNYVGVAVYCEWQMDNSKWIALETEFEQH